MTRQSRIALALTALLAASAPGAGPKPDEKLVLVELFTSQG